MSYYDYYRPEAYIPHTDVYVAKESSINDEIDRLRHSATKSLLTRRDTIVVASVSCIFGIGSPDDYQESVLSLQVAEPSNGARFCASSPPCSMSVTTLTSSAGSFACEATPLRCFPLTETPRIASRSGR